jgi:uncharacterized membrane protein YfcA
MEPQFLGVPGVDQWIFGGLAAASLATSFIGAMAGAAGGLILLALMAMIFPPSVLIPVHTVVQFGAGSSRAVMMRRWVMRGTLLPFLLGSVAGAAVGAQIFVALPTEVLEGILGAAVIALAWLPRFGRIGREGRRFAVLGFGATFLGMFISATGTLLAPFVASASPDRRNHAATLAALMALSHVTRIAAFGFLGVALASYLPLMLAMIAAAACGNWLATRTLDRMPERWFRLALQIILTGLGLRLLWAASRSAGWF